MEAMVYMFWKIRQAYILVRYVYAEGLCKVRRERVMRSREPFAK